MFELYLRKHLLFNTHTHTHKIIFYKVIEILIISALNYHVSNVQIVGQNVKVYLHNETDVITLYYFIKLIIKTKICHLKLAVDFNNNFVYI